MASPATPVGNGHSSRKNVIEIVTLIVAILGLVVTTTACVVAAVQTYLTKLTIEEEMRRRARPALVPSSPVNARVVRVQGALRMMTTVPLLNQGSGPAYRLRFFKCSQIPPLNQATASKEAVLSSLTECKAAFAVTSSSRNRQLVVGNGQSYESEMIDEVNGAFPNSGSPVIKRRLYVLCLYENEAHKEMGTVFSLTFEFSLSQLDAVDTHIQDAGILEEE